MPYIQKNKRAKLDWIASNLAAELSTNGVQGNLNYFLFRVFINLTKLKFISSYKDMAAFIGELECCKLELYRRPISKYENLKMFNNGDVE